MVFLVLIFKSYHLIFVSFSEGGQIAVKVQSFFIPNIQALGGAIYYSVHR
jgi:hypothetical protein